jgi:uncharacterized protein (DUF2336 family)
MSLSPAIIDELEIALKTGSGVRRLEVLRRMTDLFVSHAANLTEQQMKLFDDVMSRLVSHIETEAIVELSNRLAPIANAPTGIIRRLAWDDAIDVSGPVLAMSDSVTDDELVKISETKSQAHLVQIAARATLNEPVTDVLVDRGDSEVANRVAANAGARFSETGMLHLVLRADRDDRLTETIVGRSDISPHLLRQILSRATDKVRQRLLASAPPKARQVIRQVLAEISVRLRELVTSRDYAEAQSVVRSLSQDTERIKTELLEFANNKKLAELIVALSVLAAIPIELVEQLMHDDSVLGLLVLCKAIALDWAIVHAIVLARPVAKRSSSSELDAACTLYLKLSMSSAQRLLRFWQFHQKRGG